MNLDFADEVFIVTSGAKGILHLASSTAVEFVNKVISAIDGNWII
jgi:hypothetical protein